MSGEGSVPLTRLVASGGLLGTLLRGAGVPGLVPPLPRDAGEILERTIERPPAAPETVSAIVTSLEELGAPEVSRANAAALGRQGTHAVVTGQQPGLIGGPLYTVLKAVGAVRAAATLDAEERTRGTGRRWIPVFWNASEDHDLDEVNAVVLPDPEGRPRRLRADLVADGRACRDVSSEDPAFDRLLAEVEEGLPRGPAREAAAALARETRGGSIAAWFSRILLRLLGRHGLVVVEPDHVREATWWLLDREIAEPGRLTAAVMRGVEAVRAAGLRPVLEAEREVNLFAYHEGLRRAVVREEDRFRLQGTEVRLDTETLRNRIRSEPTAFSTNVALRPLVQDAALPVALQLAGPTELAYLAELGPAHDEAGIPRPLVLPRPGATIVEARVDRALRRLDLRAEDVVAEPSRLEEVGGHDEESGIRRRVEALRRATGPALEDLLSRAGPEGSASRRKAARLMGHVLENLSKLERTVLDARREERGVGRRHVDRIRHALRPLGRPQERVYGILPFLARYGEGLVDRLLEEIDPFARDHRIVRPG